MNIVLMRVMLQKFIFVRYHSISYFPMMLQWNYSSVIGKQIIHETYFDFTQHKNSHLTCSDAIRGHLMDSLCPVGKDKLYQISM